MHVIFRENHTLDDTDVPFDVNQTAAELIVLSFSDSDLGAFLAGWHRANNIPDNKNIPTSPTKVGAYTNIFKTIRK